MDRDDGLLDWLAGGPETAYSTLALCMRGDTPWIYAYIASGVYVFLSYLLIVAYFWWRYRRTRKTRFAKAMMFGALVFLWCGVSGYLMSGLVSYVWPARRLETIMRLVTGTVNLAFAWHLYKISFVERVLSIDAASFKHKGLIDAETGQ